MDDLFSEARRRYAAAKKAYANYTASDSDADTTSTDSQRATQQSNVSDNDRTEAHEATPDQNGTPSSNVDALDDEEVGTAPESASEKAANAPDDEGLSPEEQIATLKAEQEELNDRLLRQAAEFQNFRRRMQREKKKFFRSGKKEVILPMLEVLDDFQRSIEAAEQLQEQDDLEAAYESLKSGVEMVFQKFLDELGNVGVEPINAEGEPFDETVHEAMMQQPAPDGVEEGTVLQEIRRGYRLDDQVLRHSRVVVAS